MNNPYQAETGCCPRFDPQPWDEKQHHWDNKLFIKDKVFCLFHIPLGFGKAMVRSMTKIQQANAFTPQAPLALSEHTSAWNMDLYVEVSHEVPGAENTRLSGDYLSRVFEGPYKETGNWCNSMQQWVLNRGKAIKKYLMYYTTCPKCAKAYGRNYVVIFAQI